MQICGRQFTDTEIQWLRSQVEEVPGLNRNRLSQMFCRHASWLKPDGGLKEMSCRVALLKLQRSGLIELPLPRRTWRARAPIPRTPEGEPADETTLDAGAVDIHLELVGPKNRALWNELIDRYHYLGFCRTGGAQLRYFVHAGGKVVALLGFCAAAWRVASRDAFIGWSADERKNQLYRVVDNYRFLILPWIKARNLASRILSAVARRLPDDWQERYHYRPVLLESFVESGRFLGTCYKASNWLCVGETAGRGKWDRDHRSQKPIKTVWLYPLERRFKEALCQ